MIRLRFGAIGNFHPVNVIDKEHEESIYTWIDKIDEIDFGLFCEKKEI